MRIDPGPLVHATKQQLRECGHGIHFFDFHPPQLERVRTGTEFSVDRSQSQTIAGIFDSGDDPRIDVPFRPVYGYAKYRIRIERSLSSPDFEPAVSAARASSPKSAELSET